jgi:predicted amidohydrolase YtcJ
MPGLLILNGRVFGAAATKVTALAITNERISAVGSDAEIGELARPDTRVIDAEGGLISPGFNDAHVHLLNGARQLANLDLWGIPSSQGIRRRVAEFARANPEREWVVGRGWVYAAFPGGLPDHTLLDDIVPNRPAAFESYDMHTAWVNSVALSRLGISKDTPDPAGGRIVRDAEGEATGILKETAMELVHRALPPLPEAAELNLLEQAIQLAAHYGLTSLQDASLPSVPFTTIERLRERGAARLRIRLSRIMEPGQSMADWEKRLAEYGEDSLGRRGDPWLSGGILKTFMDGVVESRTASMLAPYEGLVPGQAGATGDLRWEPAEFEAALSIADRLGWQVQAHAIGDRAIRTALDAFEAVALTNGPRDRRHRIEHIEAIDPADIPRFARLQVVASMQPFHADPSPNLFEMWSSQIGPQRASHGWSWASIRRSGGRLAFGSDWPVVGLDPRLGLNMAVNRTTPQGGPPGGWLPNERLPLMQALEAYTAGSAFAAFAETGTGSLRPGMLADITVFDRDLLSEPPAELLSAQVRATIVGGQPIYEATTTRV